MSTNISSEYILWNLSVMVAGYCNPASALIVLSLFLSFGKIDFLSYYFSLLGHVLPQNFFASFLSAQEANRGGNYKHRSMPHKILGRMSGVFPLEFHASVKTKINQLALSKITSFEGGRCLPATLLSTTLKYVRAHEYVQQVTIRRPLGSFSPFLTPSTLGTV